MEGIARFLPEPAGCRDQVRAGGRAVPGAEHARAAAAARRRPRPSSRSRAKSPSPMSAWWTATASVCSTASASAFRSATHVALVGPSNSGKNLVPQLLARLYAPTSGRITIGGTDINTLPLAVSGRLVGYVGPATHLFSASMRDNLLLGLRHRPPSAEAADGSTEGERAAPSRGAAIRQYRARHRRRLDRLRAGRGGRRGRTGDAASIEVLRLVDLDGDVYLFGLHGRLDPRAEPGGCGPPARSAAALRRTPRQRRARRPCRALRRGPLQHQCLGRRQPAVRHPDRGRVCRSERWPKTRISTACCGRPDCAPTCCASGSSSPI